MAITPNPFSIDTSQTQELTGSFIGIWSVLSGAGSLAAGSNPYKRIFSPSGAGPATVQNRSSIWGIAPAGVNVQANDNLMTDSSGTGDVVIRAVAFANSTGDKITQTNTPGVVNHFTNSAGTSRYYFFNNYLYSIPAGMIVYTDPGGSFSSGQISAEIGAGGVWIFKLNGTTIYTTPADQDAMGFYYEFYYAAANLSVAQPVFSGSGISGITIETCSGTVSNYVDNAPQSNVTNLTIDLTQHLNSDAATDNISSGITYLTQRAADTSFTSPLTLSNTGKTFKDIEALPTAPGTYTFYYRRKARDAAGNLSAAWSNVVSFIYVVTTPPVVLPINPVPFAQIGQPFSIQLNAAGGSGSGTWSKVSGSGTVSANGVFTINPVPSVNIAFTARYTDANGTFDDETFTIPVSEYAWISLCHKRPLPRKVILNQRIFTPLEGAEEVIEDAAPKYEYQVQNLYIGRTNGNALREFLFNHRKRQPFLWYNPDRAETRLVKLMSGYDEEEMLSYGGFQIVLRDV